MEGRVAVEHLGYGADAVVEEFLLIAYELTLDEADARVAEHLEACLEVEAGQPRPCRALVVGVVTLHLRADVHGIVATALRR